MNRCHALWVLAFGLVACGTVPAPGPRIVQHDLGIAAIPADLAKGLPVRNIVTTAHPAVAGTAMQYREAALPTRRSAWATHRWSVPPAAMVEAALSRTIVQSSAPTRCTLSVQLTEFIVEVDENREARARVQARAKLIVEQEASTSPAELDAQYVLGALSPDGAALAFSEAVKILGTRAVSAFSSEANARCKPPRP
jgi:hypothetical protein